jgi:hypothetical protein
MGEKELVIFERAVYNRDNGKRDRKGFEEK